MTWLTWAFRLQFAEVRKCEPESFIKTRVVLKMGNLCILIVFRSPPKCSCVWWCNNHHSRFTVSFYRTVFHVLLCLSIGVICIVNVWGKKNPKVGHLHTWIMHEYTRASVTKWFSVLISVVLNSIFAKRKSYDNREKQHIWNRPCSWDRWILVFVWALLFCVLFGVRV